MPVGGYDTWFKLEPRSSTSKVQGECHLILKLFTNQVRGGAGLCHAGRLEREALMLLRFCAERHEPVQEGLPRLHPPETADPDPGVRTQSSQSEFF